MSIHATSKPTRSPGPDARINCPACGPDVPARTFQLVEKMGVEFVPLITQKEVYVECASCGDSRLTRLPLETLGAMTADELDGHLFRRVSLIVKFLGIASLLLSCVPFVGLGLGVAGFIASYRTGGWIKVVSLIAIVLGVIPTAFAIFAMMQGH